MKYRLDDAAELYQAIKPYVVEQIAGGASDGSTSGTVATHSHPTYMTQAAADARYPLLANYNTHVADADAHHNRQHVITSASDHTVTGSQYDIVGLSAANTLGVLTPVSDGSDGDGILITDGSGDITINALTTDANLAVGTSATVGTTLGVTGAGTFSSTVDVTGNFTVDTDTFYVNATQDSVGINVTPDATAGLWVKAPGTGSETLRLEEIASQSGNLLEVWPDTGSDTYVTITPEGYTQSGNYRENDIIGWRLSPNSKPSRLYNVDVMGTLRASIFSIKEITASGGTIILTEKGPGKLFEDFTISADVAADDVSKPSVDIKIEDSPVGAFATYSVGDILHIAASASLPSITEPISPIPFDVAPVGTVGGLKTIINKAWFTITSVARGGTDDHSVYTCEVELAVAGTFQAGTAVVNYGQYVAGFQPPGHLRLSADDNLSPTISAVLMEGNEPWDVSEFRTLTRFGHIRDAEGNFGEARPYYGFAVSTDMDSTTAPRFEANQDEIFTRNILTKSYGTVQGSTTLTGVVYPNGSWKYTGRTQADSGFTPSIENGTGDIASDFVGVQWSASEETMVIGQYPSTDGHFILLDGDGEITLGGGITIDASSLVGTIGFDSLRGAKKYILDQWVSEHGGVAGMYLRPEFIGFYDGTAFTSYWASNGDFYFGGDSGPHIEWNQSDGQLKGLDNTDTVQWYADADDGKLYAGAGTVILDEDGIDVTAHNADTHVTANTYTTSYGGEAIGSVGARAINTNDAQLVISAQGRNGSSAWGTILLHAATGANGLYDSTINGGALIVQPENIHIARRGLIVDDTVLFDHIGDTAPRGHIQCGTLNIQNLPTSAGGLNTGDLWNDSGTVKVA